MIAEWIHMHADASALVGYDVIVILLLVRALLSLGIATLFFIEPRKCGGKNRAVHWTLAMVFVVGAWSAMARAIARMQAVYSGSGALAPEGALLVSEIAIIVIELVLLGIIVYQEFNAKTKDAYNLNSACDGCEYLLECGKHKKGA